MEAREAQQVVQVARAEARAEAVGAVEMEVGARVATRVAAAWVAEMEEAG